MFPLLDLGFVSIPTYSTVFLLGFVAAILAAVKIGPSQNVEKADILYASIYMGIGLVIGAKILYFITKLPSILAIWGTIVKNLQKDTVSTLMHLLGYSFGGLVFYGGLIGALLGLYIYCRQFKIAIVPFLDIFAPLIPFVHGVGRIGCFLSGCCYGIEYHGFGSVRFPHSDIAPELDRVPRFPVQLLEAGMNFIFCGILIYIARKGKLKNGKMMGIYLLYYTVARFGLEFLRGDKVRGSISIFSTSQFISLLLIPLGILLVRGRGEKTLQ